MSKKRKLSLKTVKPLTDMKVVQQLIDDFLRNHGEEEVVNIVLRNECLLIKQPDFDKKKWVESYLEFFYQALLNKTESILLQDVANNFNLIMVVNDYFSKIHKGRLNIQESNDISMQEIVSASLVRGCEDYLEIAKRAKELALSQTKGNNFYDSESSTLIKDSFGNTIDPDDAISSVAESIHLILKSTGFLEGRQKGEDFDFKEFLYPDEDVLTKVSALNLNAMVWHNFDFLQKSIRYNDRKWNYHSNNSKIPQEYKEYIDECLEVDKQSNWSYLEMVANHRLRQYSKEVYFNTFRACMERGVSLSQAELNKLSSRTVLERILSLDLNDERNSCLGLTLLQWLDGYSALSKISSDLYEENVLDSLMPRFKKDDLVSKVVEQGLPSGIAEKFIDNVVYGPRSIDIYDTPVIKFGDEYLVYGPTLKDALLYELVISNVTRNKERLLNKGNALEDKLFYILEKQGFEPKRIKEKIGREEYQYDVVMRWDNTLFVFECKNRALARDPITSRNIEDDYNEHAQQLLRLCSGLENNPGIIAKYFGGSNEFDIVLCVVNGMPFSLDAPLHVGGREVFVTDINIINRFFESSEIEYNIHDRNFSVYSQWSAKQPTLNDFLFHMKHPYQVEFHKRYISTEIRFLPISDKVFLKAELPRYQKLGWEDTKRFFIEHADFKRYFRQSYEAM